MALDPQDGTRDYDAERYEGAPTERSGGDPTCSCPEYGDGPEAADCPLHGVPEATAAEVADAEVHGAQGGGPHADPWDADPMPTRWFPGHEDCHPGGRQYDAEFGWVCSCGAILGELPAATREPTQAEVDRTAAGLERDEPDDRDPIRTALRAMDPTHYTPAQVEQQLVDIMRRLETGAQYQRECEVLAADLRVKLDVAMAETVERMVSEGAKGGADGRKATAVVENRELYERTLRAEARVRSVRETMHTVRSMQTGFQSIARSVGLTYSSPAAGGSW